MHRQLRLETQRTRKKGWYATSVLFRCVDKVEHELSGSLVVEACFVCIIQLRNIAGSGEPFIQIQVYPPESSEPEMVFLDTSKQEILYGSPIGQPGPAASNLSSKHPSSVYSQSV